MNMCSRRRLIRRFCELFVEKARVLLRATPPRTSPCHSCAFGARSEKWVGFEKTIYNVMQAVQHDRPFYCHRNMKKVDGEYVAPADLAGMIPCANYEAIRGRPEVIEAIEDAATESDPRRTAP